MNLPIDIEASHPVFKAWFLEIDTQKDNKISQTEMLNYMNKFTHPFGTQFVVVKIVDDKDDALPAKTGRLPVVIESDTPTTLPEEEEKPKVTQEVTETKSPLGDLFNYFSGNEESDSDIVIQNEDEREINNSYNSEAEYKEHQPKATSEDVSSEDESERERVEAIKKALEKAEEESEEKETWELEAEAK